MNEHSAFSQVLRFFLKDIRIIWRFLMLALLAYVVYAAIFYALTPYYFLATMLFTLFFAVGVTIVDDYYRAHSLFCSLPIRRTVIVIGRYASSIVMLLLGICLCFGYAFLLDLVIDAEFAVYEPGIMASGILPFAVASLVFLCLFYPLYFRFGIVKATVVFVSTVMVAGLLVFGIKALLSSLGVGLPWPANPWMSLLTAFSALRPALSTAGAITAAVALAAVVVWISAALSVRLFETREF